MKMNIEQSGPRISLKSKGTWVSNYSKNFGVGGYQPIRYPEKHPKEHEKSWFKQFEVFAGGS